MRGAALILVLATTASLFGQYRVTHTYTLGGEESWDYVIPDPPNHR